MTDTGNYAFCERAHSNLRDLQSERYAKQSEILDLEEQIAVREIAQAENTLSSLVAALDNIGDAAIGAGLSALQRDVPGTVRDGIAAAVKLTNEIARQEQELARLQSQLRNELWQLQAARNALALLESDIQRTIKDLNAHDCW